MCSRPVKIPKLDTDDLEPTPILEKTEVINDSDPLPIPTSSKSSQNSPLHSQSSNPDSSEITLVLEMPAVSAHINNTIKLQTIIDSLDEAMEDEIERVQRRFYRQKRPYFEERRAVLERIPGFWRTTFLRHPDLASIMEALDTQILEYLYSVDVLEYSDGDCAYKISFSFKENPFFSNQEFTKEVRLMDSDELVSIGTKIKWKEPYALLNRRVKPGTKRGQDEPRCEFFFWFSSSNCKYLDRIGEILKDDIWPNPVKYFFQHTGSTEQLVVLSDSGSETHSGHMPLGAPNINNYDVISIDDDEEYDFNYPGEDDIFRGQTPEQINGDLTSSSHDSSHVYTSPLVETNTMNTVNLESSNSPTTVIVSNDIAHQPECHSSAALSDSELVAMPSSPINQSNQDVRPTSPSSQSQITLEIQQESEA